MRAWPVLFLAFVLLLPAECWAQRYTFKHYMQAEGLRNLNVMAMLQDGNGFIWAATQNGVFRYDGFRFEEIRLAPGAATSTANAMYEDSGGRIWVGLESTVEVFQDGKFQTVLCDGKDLPMHAGSTFSSFRQDHDKVFAASQGALFEFTQAHSSSSRSSSSRSSSTSSSSTWTARKVPVNGVGGSPLEVHSVLARSDGSLMLGCGSGICRLDRARLTTWGPRQGLQKDVWDILSLGSNGDLWARSDSHLAVLPKGEQAFQKRDLPGPVVKADYYGISEDRAQRMLTFSGQRLLRWEGKSWKVFDEHQGLSSPTISALLVDGDGEIWLGSTGHGIDKWLGYGNWEQWTVTEGLQSNEVWAVVRGPGGRLWVGNGNGVAFLDPGATRFVPWRIPLSQRALSVQTLAVARDGGVWMGASGGHLLRIDPATHAVARADLNVKINRLLATKAGQVWAGTIDGMYRVDPSHGYGSRKISFSHSFKGWVNDAAEAPDGQIFVRTDTSLWRFDGSAWHEIQLGPDLRLGGFWADLDADSVNSHGSTSKGSTSNGSTSIWTDGAAPGMAHLQIQQDRVVSIERYGTSTIGSNETVLIAHDRHGRIWAGSDAGIAFLDSGKWRLLTQEQGLLWNDTDSKTFLEDTDGSFWIGTTGGLSHLISVNPYLQSRRLKLTAISATFGTTVLHPGQPASLAWNRVPLIIQMALPTFHEGSGLKLHYRLLGLEQNWIEAANQEIRYPQLAPGSYTFEAFAADTSRAENSEVFRLAFVIHPPWWHSNGAIFLYSLLGLGFIVFLWRWRVNSLVSRQRELEAMVAQRTEELDQKKAEAEAANSAKSDFLARMSHEIRTPLNGVIGMTSVLREMSLGGRERECVDTIYHSSDLLLTVLNDILDFSKIEAGKLELENVPFDLAQTLQQCAYLLAEPVRKKGLTLALEIDALRPDLVVGDPTRLRQVVLNLLSNAVKFTAQGRVELRAFEETQVSSNKRKLRFEVRDSGPGLTPDVVAKLFTSFSQADTSTSRKYGGTGLGLAICKQLVDLMGGTIGASSQPGEGSLFWFAVELASAKGARQPAALPYTKEPSTAKISNGGVPPRWHVLVAEDNVVNTRVVARVLELLGHTAEFVTDGAAAVELAGSKRFDIILMDCQMPGMDGLQATQAIRANEGGGRVPIVAVTASALANERSCYLAAGMDDVLAKPFKKEELENVLNRWLLLASHVDPGVDSPVGVK